MILDYFIYAVLGKVLMFLWKKTPYAAYLGRWKFFADLFGCDLCLGVWVYTALAFLMKMNLFEKFYVPIINEIITGGVTSFVVFCFCVGWFTLYGTYEVK